MNPPQFLKPFGPTIYSNLIDDEFFDLLMSAKQYSEDNPINVSNKLAGFIKNQLRMSLTDEQHEQIGNMIFEHAAVYINTTLEDVKKRFYLPKESLWVNLQTAGEFNPNHHHSGSLSGVIYLDVPMELLSEKYNPEATTTFNNFGEIGFYYGDGEYCERYFYLMPQTKQILIFPAGLEHGVFPFYSNVTRVSVAFNLFENKNFWDIQ